MSKVVNFQQLRAQIGGRRDSTADCEVRKRNETSSSTKTTSAASTFTGPTSNEGMKDSATELPHPTLPTSPPPTTALVIELSVPQHAPAATAAPASVLVPTEVINLEGSLEGVVGSSGTESKTFCWLGAQSHAYSCLRLWFHRPRQASIRWSYLSSCGSELQARPCQCNQTGSLFSLACRWKGEGLRRSLSLWFRHDVGDQCPRMPGFHGCVVGQMLGYGATLSSGCWETGWLAKQDHQVGGANPGFASRERRLVLSDTTHTWCLASIFLVWSSYRIDVHHTHLYYMLKQ